MVKEAAAFGIARVCPSKGLLVLSVTVSVTGNVRNRNCPAKGTVTPIGAVFNTVSFSQPKV
jgi:hypothetical protein